MKSWPSVTRVLSPWQDFTKVLPDVLEAACLRGSQIHALIACILQDLWVPPIPPECEPFIDSFRLWLPCIEEVVFVEKRLSDPIHKYRGTPDALVRFRGDKVYTLPDWKSPVIQSLSWEVQVSTYRKLAQIEYPDLPIERVGALQLSPKGKSAVFREYTGQKEHRFSIFLNALSVYRFFKK